MGVLHKNTVETLGLNLICDLCCDVFVSWKLPTFFLSNSLNCLSFFQSNLGSAGGPLQRMCGDCGKLLGLILKLCAVIYSPWFIHSTFLHALQGGYFGSRPGLIKIYVPCLYQT